MSADLTADNVRRLDAYNLVEALADGDHDKARAVLALHSDDSTALYRLALSLSFTAAELVRVLPDARHLLAAFRAHDLSDAGQDS